jgi:hypothetical protein
MNIEDYERLAELTRRGPMPCPHARVFPIREKYLHFWCLDCKKQLEVRNARSLRVLNKTFRLAGGYLVMGMQVGTDL